VFDIDIHFSHQPIARGYVRKQSTGVDTDNYEIILV